MNSESDTIAAIATASGEAGISIIRLSGSESISIADKIFSARSQNPSNMQSQTFLHGYVRSVVGDDPSSTSSDIDEVILLKYKAPYSYTREDVVEIQGHGGRISAQRILRSVLQAGARMAEPGEFTKRAFLNGRVDLLQAEAVLDLIRASSDRAANAAIEQLEGRLSDLFTAFYDDLLSVASDLEATLDFSDQELPEAVMVDIVRRIEKLNEQINAILNTWQEGRLLREGAKVVISGKPNVGKSTLMNRLLEFDRAIVTDIPGTTRDIIEEQIVIEGIPFRLIDTAGLRASDCQIEQLGIQRAQTAIEKADINILVVDASQPVDQETIAQVSLMNPARTIVVLNKCDLSVSVKDEFSKFQAIKCSLLKNEGLTAIRKAIITKTNISPSTTPSALISERHRQIIQYVLNMTTEVLPLLHSGREDLIVPVAAKLKDALEHLGTITGRTYNEELLDNIFNRFCIGK